FDSLALPIKNRESLLGVRKILFGGGAEPTCSGCKILRNDFAFEMEEREIIGSGRIAAFGCIREQARSFVAINLAAPALQIKRTQPEHGFAVAGRSREPVPFGREFVVERHANSVSI